jgi:hypothetical protein
MCHVHIAVGIEFSTVSVCVCFFFCYLLVLSVLVLRQIECDDNVTWSYADLVEVTGGCAKYYTKELHNLHILLVMISQ